MGSRRQAALAPALVVIAGLLAFVGLSHAAAATRTGGDPLGALAPLLDALLAGSAALHGAVARATAALRGPAALLALAALALPLALGRALPFPARLLGTLSVCWMAQSFLSDGRLAAGAALYAAAAALYCVQREPPAPLDGALPRGRERAAYALLLGIFLALCLHRIDLHPPLYFDETAYLMAARMQLGELEPGPISIPPIPQVYHFERFRAQPVPFAYHAAALALLGPGALAPRLFAALAGLATLVIGALAARRHLGARVALAMTALAAPAPVLLAYSRAGFYLALSLTHGALVVAATARLAERRDVASALWLGVLLGGAIAFYQLSWFAPILALLSLATATGWRPWRRRWAPLAALGAGASAVALSAALLLAPGLERVAAQTEPRSELSLRPEWLARATGSADLGIWHAVRTKQQLRAAGLDSRIHCTASDRVALDVFGKRDALGRALARLQSQGWEVGQPRREPARWLRNLRTGAARFFHAPGCESSGRRIAAPLPTHLLAPLILLGVLEALRRRRQPAVRALLVYVAGAAVLPIAVADALPRRTLLMLPFVYALAALPLVEAWQRSGGAPRARAAAAAALLAAVIAAGAHAYFERWYPPPEAGGSGGPADASGYASGYDVFLEASRTIKTLPPDEEIVLSAALPGFRALLRIVDGEVPRSAGGRLRTPLAAPDDPAALRRYACAARLPFTWIAGDEPAVRGAFAVLHRAFRTQAQVHRPLRFVRVLERRPGACAR